MGHLISRALRRFTQCSQQARDQLASGQSDERTNGSDGCTKDHQSGAKAAAATTVESIPVGQSIDIAEYGDYNTCESGRATGNSAPQVTVSTPTPTQTPARQLSGPATGEIGSADVAADDDNQPTEQSPIGADRQPKVDELATSDCAISEMRIRSSGAGEAEAETEQSEEQICALPQQIVGQVPRSAAEAAELVAKAAATITDENSKPQDVEEAVIKIQAYVRGHLTRKALRDAHQQSAQLQQQNAIGQRQFDEDSLIRSPPSAVFAPTLPLNNVAVAPGAALPTTTAASEQQKVSITRSPPLESIAEVSEAAAGVRNTGAVDELADELADGSDTSAAADAPVPEPRGGAGNDDDDDDESHNGTDRTTDTADPDDTSRSSPAPDSQATGAVAADQGDAAHNGGRHSDSEEEEGGDDDDDDDELANAQTHSEQRDQTKPTDPPATHTNDGGQQNE